ncbi:redox-sensing transcriptional repressor Rex [Dermacoccus nishinomiyaensis]|uniref:redox-sensing transcriptional repressor Rex n=1 Tax=Dermacoccus TaxID=57495 RepID=UPI000DB5C421|nr:redox-sensing transcriptional repressor Rex [Dermacoccus nishinomiyaensis]MBO1756966.1 redox-sensing transcriptional repressor Rex [Dermacoccus sp. NHGro5]PZP03950.1 MAG: redox-sensing transcriptional repressor Rex [Dermacoccus nishinomiyaensis]TJZ96667.1 redox-sensing transcriptional repressor Rex [Dermacoccus nishinomiyaensis]HCQ19506.1 redox-sensing transcriptional repressor Rex [Dermacoccus sp.]
MSTEHVERREIPDATVNRLPVYLRVLNERAAVGQERISSEALAEQAGVSSAKLRKDLSALGSYGVRGVGYDIVTLADHVAGALGLEREWSVAIIGMGNLGRALATYGGIGVKGFDIKWLIDDDPRVVGTDVGGRVIVPFEALRPEPGEGVIGIIATPATAAQQVADRLVVAGVRSILNFAPTVLTVPADVQVRGVDMAGELQILAFREQHSRLARSRTTKELLA